MTVQASKGTVKAFANATKRLAQEDKKFAEELVFRHGIRGEITPKAVKQLTKDMFDSAGKLTEAGKNEVKGLIEAYNLSGNATWDEILQKVSEVKKRLALNMNKLTKLKAEVSRGIPIEKGCIKLSEKPDYEMMNKMLNKIINNNNFKKINK